MGWQSYVIGYNTLAERKRIIEVCQDHNIGSFSSFDERDEYGYKFGEKLIMFCEAHFKVGKEYKRGRLRGYSKVIMCGNGGGRTSTFRYLTRNLGFQVEGFSDSLERRLKNAKTWEKVEFINHQYRFNLNNKKVLEELKSVCHA